MDLDSGDLERNGNRSRLQEQPLQVLGELISRAGGVVTREQLIALLWPTGVVDFDTGLNTAIRKLRNALRDTADTPRCIETLPLDDAHSSAPPAVTLPARRMGWVALATVLTLLASAALLVTLNSLHSWRNPFANARFSRLTGVNGKEQAAAVSRDGKLAAFVSDQDGQNDVWITEIGSGRYRNLTQGTALELVNPAIRTLGFSPDAAFVTVWQRSSDGPRSGTINIAGTGTASREFRTGEL